MNHNLAKPPGYGSKHAMTSYGNFPRDWEPVDNRRMPQPKSDPMHPAAVPVLPGQGLDDDCHDQDLLDWLAVAGVRPPDWSFDISELDPAFRLQHDLNITIKTPGEKVVSGVYLFYDRIPASNGYDPNGAGIVPLYVGKALNLWNRMQAHWLRPDSGSWLQLYYDDVEKGLLIGFAMACAWREEERAGVEARLIKLLKPRYCRRTE